MESAGTRGCVFASVCLWVGDGGGDGRMEGGGAGEEGGVGKRRKEEGQGEGRGRSMGKGKEEKESGGVRKCYRSNEGEGLNLPSQLDRNHSLQQHPAGKFDMEIHDRVNKWTQRRSNTYITGNSPATYLTAAFTRSRQLPVSLYV